MLSWLISKEGRGALSASVAAFFVGENLRLGWASREAAIRGALAVGVYNVWDILVGGLSWKRAEHIIHHLCAVVGCGLMLKAAAGNGGLDYEKLKPLVYWMGLAEVSTIFNGLRVAQGGIVAKSLFASSFLVVRPVASVGAVRVLVKKWAERSHGENAILTPLVGTFVILNGLWSYKILLELRKIFVEPISDV